MEHIPQAKGQQSRYTLWRCSQGVGGTANNVVQEVGAVSSSRAGGSPSYVREVVSNRVYHLIPDYGGHKFSTSDRHACGIKSANFQKRGVLYKQQR
ncbi:hypothetical protein, partial [Gemmiger formicilis]